MNKKYICIFFLCFILLLICTSGNHIIQNNFLDTQLIDNIYIIKKNFLDTQLIDNIYDTITYDRDWIYTTNINNKKIKHNKNIQGRKIRANKMYNLGLFSYSKYEYNDNSPILKLIKNVLMDKKILDTVSELTGENITKIMDIFISKFEKGDFLSEHNDNTLGKYAFMIYLNKNWDIKCGGNLNIIKDDKTVDTVIPGYNKLILMDVYSKLRPHYIDKVKCDKNRYAITGWFA